MSIDPNDTTRPDDEDEVLVASFAAELAEVTDADEAIAAMRAPRIPSGGRAEDWVKPQIERVTTWREALRRWSPAAAGTAIFLILLLTPVPLTGPLTVYALGWAAFGWWLSLGRPGVRDSAALAWQTALTVWQWLTLAADKAVATARRSRSHRQADTDPTGTEA
ncbi:hypothetical protein IU501_07210 [Nocardia otitidiscaviarum]|uniref:hypothetical protein n=1 Tax=Nocardia otitidiscaviarum TaxID=1823 RepID=UPI0018956142|nr:hypothetical protein [Nocardia otitidiscaviarum]MBF6132790.1 hypothetical protein [Nocardia otitidiscaviarum]